MKKLILVSLLFAGIATASNAQSSTQKTKLKKHQCATACTNGKHVYAHGEKKHVCTDECKKMEEQKMALKDHVCTDACKNGTHVYAHGEKGHICTEACKKNM